MKKGLNIIQIKGFRGILYIVFIGCCLVAGFGWFPAWTCMKLWNLLPHFIERIPSIGIIQGLLLWGIIAGSYYTFRKDKLVVCMKASEELSEEELKSVFEEMKKQAKNDTFLKNMIKAQNAELKIKDFSENKILSECNNSNNNMNDAISSEDKQSDKQTEKIES